MSFDMKGPARWSKQTVSIALSTSLSGVCEVCRSLSGIPIKQLWGPQVPKPDPAPLSWGHNCVLCFSHSNSLKGRLSPRCSAVHAMAACQHKYCMASAADCSVHPSAFSVPIPGLIPAYAFDAYVACHSKYGVPCARFDCFEALQQV